MVLCAAPHAAPWAAVSPHCAAWSTPFCQDASAPHLIVTLFVTHRCVRYKLIGIAPVCKVKCYVYRNSTDVWDLLGREEKGRRKRQRQRQRQRKAGFRLSRIHRIPL